MTDVALATCRTLPEPDIDEQPLLHALLERGLDAVVGAWDDPDFDWSAPRLTVVRSTWNYYRWPGDFIAWMQRIEAGTGVLHNPADVMRWNTHKGYLRELERAGVPIVPTRWLEQGCDETLADAAAALDELVGGSVSRLVVKPAVSAGSWRTVIADRNDLTRGSQHLRAIVADRDAMVQPYLDSVDEYGERSLVFVAGELCHAIRKSARFEGQEESVSLEPVAIADDEAALAAQVLELVPGNHELLYARVDLTRDAQGAACLMELELIEPSLFLVQSSDTLNTFADEIAAAVEAT